MNADTYKTKKNNKCLKLKAKEEIINDMISKCQNVTRKAFNINMKKKENRYLQGNILSGKDSVLQTNDMPDSDFEKCLSPQFFCQELDATRCQL